MEKLRFFYAAAFVAALTGCPGPLPPDMPDSHVDPGDTGPDMHDAYVDPMVDAGVDAYVPPDPDGGMSTCSDPEFIGVECNLPMGMTYDVSTFACAVAIDNDLWMSDAVGATPQRVGSRTEGGLLLVDFPFTVDNSGMNMPVGRIGSFTCGNMGKCWLNWGNPDSHYSHCSATFTTDCSEVTLDCYMPGISTPDTNHAYYAGT